MDKRMLIPFISIGIGVILIFGIFIYASTIIPPKSSDQVIDDTVSVLSAEDVAAHDTEDDCWVIVDDGVYDLTPFVATHPTPYNCGQDETERYHGQHGEGIRTSLQEALVGRIAE